MSGTVIAIINDKGGVAKSTTSICLATHYMNQGKSVALVDADARHSCIDWAAAAEKADKPTPMMIGAKGLDIGDKIKTLKKFHDFIIVDGMSSFVNFDRSGVIVEILRQADYVLIPTEPSKLDLWALSDFAPLIKTRQMEAEGQPKTYLFGSKVRDNTTLWKEFLEQKDFAPFPLMEKYIPLSADMERSIGEGLTPLSLKENNKTRVAMTQWFNEVEEIINE